MSSEPSLKLLPFCSDPVVPYVNYFYTHKGTGGRGKTQTRRAAELVRATDVFRDLVESCVWPLFSRQRNLTDMMKGFSCRAQETTRAGTGSDDAASNVVLQEPVRSCCFKRGKLSTDIVHLCCRSSFNASRIPVIPSDQPKKYPTADGQNDHIIVLRKNRYFEVRVGGLGVDEIERLLNEIVAEVGDDAGKEEIGVLTAANRDVWTKVRRACKPSVDTRDSCNHSSSHAGPGSPARSLSNQQGNNRED